MIPLGVVLGIPFRMHMAFPVMIGCAVFLGYGRLLLPMLFALMMHEAFHAIAARAVGQRFETIELMPFGGVAHMKTVLTLRPAQECFIAAAGPIGSLLLAMGIALMGKPGSLTQDMVRANLSLACMNMLPALPLDGGRALCAAFSLRLGKAKTIRIFARIGIGMGVVVIVLGIWAAFQGVINPMLFLMGVYLIYAALKERQTLAVACLEALHNREKRLRREGVLPIRWMAAHQDLSPERLTTYLSAGSYHLFVRVDEEMRSLEMVDEGEILHRAFQSKSAPFFAEKKKEAAKDSRKETL